MTKRPKGLRTQPHDPIGSWQHSWNWQARVRSERERLGRNKAVGANSRYAYAMGINFVMLSGKVCREPISAGLRGKEWVWFRIAVPDQDRKGRWLFLPVRTAGALAYYTYANVLFGDTVCVVGRIYSARMPIDDDGSGKRVWKQFNYLIAENVSPSHPVCMDKDPRFVRVRVDLFNRLCSLSEDMHAHRIPIDKQRELGMEASDEKEPPLYDQAMFSIDEDQPDTDLTTIQDPE